MAGLMWGRALSAVRRVLGDTAVQGFSVRSRSAATFGYVSSIVTTQKPSEQQLSTLIARRAQKVCNRSKSKARQYEQTHAKLIFSGSKRATDATAALITKVIGWPHDD